MLTLTVIFATLCSFLAAWFSMSAHSLLQSMICGPGRVCRHSHRVLIMATIQSPQTRIQLYIYISYEYMYICHIDICNGLLFIKNQNIKIIYKMISFLKLKWKWFYSIYKHLNFGWGKCPGYHSLQLLLNSLNPNQSIVSIQIIWFLPSLVIIWVLWMWPFPRTIFIKGLDLCFHLNLCNIAKRETCMS